MISQIHFMVIMILSATLSLEKLPAMQTTPRAAVQETDQDEQDQLVNELISVLEQNAKDPVDFIVEKFEQHDIILLGEVHHVKANCELVASLIEPMNARGIKRLCSEFTPTRFNHQLKRIVTDMEYDESAVMDLFRKGPWPNWGHREYMDIIKEAWTVNQNLAKDELPFLIIGIDSDWSQVEHFDMDRQQRFEMLVNREQHMNGIIVETAIEQDQKTLVHIGFAHTVPNGIRVGNELKKNMATGCFR